MSINNVLQCVVNHLAYVRVESPKKEENTNRAMQKIQNVFTTIRDELSKVPDHIKSSPSYKEIKAFWRAPIFNKINMISARIDMINTLFWRNIPPNVASTLDFCFDNIVRYSPVGILLSLLVMIIEQSYFLIKARTT